MLSKMSFGHTEVMRDVLTSWPFSGKPMEVSDGVAKARLDPCTVATFLLGSASDGTAARYLPADAQRYHFWLGNHLYDDAATSLSLDFYYKNVQDPWSGLGKPFLSADWSGHNIGANGVDYRLRRLYEHVPMSATYNIALEPCHMKQGVKRVVLSRLRSVLESHGFVVEEPDKAVQKAGVIWNITFDGVTKPFRGSFHFSVRSWRTGADPNTSVSALYPGFQSEWIARSGYASTRVCWKVCTTWYSDPYYMIDASKVPVVKRVAWNNLAEALVSQVESNAFEWDAVNTRVYTTGTLTNQIGWLDNREVVAQVSATKTPPAETRGEVMSYVAWALNQTYGEIVHDAWVIEGKTLSESMTRLDRAAVVKYIAQQLQAHLKSRKG